MAEVKVYSTPTCPWCKKLKDWMSENGIKFEDVNVGADQNAARQMIEKSGQMGVPQTEINGKMIVGFDPDSIKKALENA
ncbi:MAG TPA: NrdH-redoxin [Candidatus Altiarchaeales archaeon]|nr:NrdH-redoxin [Candidatus Altiarchaeales archaeon]